MGDRRVPLRPTDADVGIYVHFPFCLRHCPYCDFAVVVTASIPHAAYADAVIEEMRARAPRALGGRTPTSLYFGGGTPGIWAPDALGRVVEAARALGLAPAAQITVEMNPEEASTRRLADLRALGVDRVSFGVQSFCDRTLEILGRNHDGAQARAALAAAAAVGFPHISLDWMYAVPGQPDGRIDADIDVLQDLDGVDHVSVYELTIEPLTAFDARRRAGVWAPPTDDASADDADALAAALVALGFEQYEVASWAKGGGRSVHNQLYWVGADYLGVGVGAHSFHWDSAARRGVRRGNQRHPRRWLADPDGDPQFEEVLPASVHLRERLMTGMRMVEGVELDGLRARFPDELAEVQPVFARWCREGLATRTEDRVVPTSRGLDVADTLAAHLFGA